MSSSGSFPSKFFIWCIAGGAVLYLLYLLGDLVKVVLIGSLLAYILDPIASLLESRGMGRTVATAAIFAAILIAVVGIIAVGLPMVITEVQSFRSGSGTAQSSMFVAQIESIINDKLAFWGMPAVDLESQVARFRAEVGQKVLDALIEHASEWITYLLIIPFIVFFLIKDGREMKKHLVSLVPNRYFEFSLNLLHKMDQQLGNYLRGQFLDAVIIGLLSTAAMWILGVRYFAIIGIFSGAANLIPYVGPIAGGSLAVTVTLMTTGDVSFILWVILAFVIIQLLDESVVAPVVIAKSVNIHPLMVLFAIIIGGKFFGILGMLLSVPFVGFVNVIARESRITMRKYKFSSAPKG